MKILIVNGYSKNAEGMQKFTEFQYLIMKIFAEQKELIDTETEFFIRDQDNIEDFLYEVEGSFLKKQAANNFDQVDIVFLTGDANVRPWSASMQKNISIINGNGDGGQISDLPNFHIKLGEFTNNHFFLDNTTGDLYSFSYESGEWVPRGNCGLHYRRAAQEFQSIGKYMLKAPVYKANTEHQEKYKLFQSRQYQELCTLKKMHLHHWLFSDMDHEFIVPLKNSWDPHSFTFTNPNQTFHVLAECQRCALVIQEKHTAATLFPNTAQYPNTILPLRNFIFNTLKQIQSASGPLSQRIIPATIGLGGDSKIEEILKKQKEKSSRNALKLLNQRAKHMGFQLNQFDNNNHDNKGGDNNQEFKHVGFSAKRSHMPDIVSKNAVSEKQIKAEGLSIVEKKKTQFVFQSSDVNFNETSVGVQSAKGTGAINDKYSVKMGEKDLLSSAGRSTAVPSPKTSYMHSRNNSMPDNSLLPQSGKVRFKNNNFFDNRNKLESPRVDFQEEEENEHYANMGFLPSKEIDYGIQFTKGGVRHQLHPGLSMEYLNFDQVWVPGQLNEFNCTLKRGIKVSTPISEGDNRPATTVSKAKRTQNILNQGPVLFTSISKPGKFFGKVSSIFNGSQFQSQQDVMKQYQKEYDKNILFSKGFRTGINARKGPIEQSEIPNYVRSSPSENPMNYQFRRDHLQKWIGPCFKI